MRRPRARTLFITGGVLVALGALSTLAAAIGQSACDDGSAGPATLPNLAPHAPGCAGWAWAAGLSWTVLALGALCFLIGLVYSTPRFRPPPGPEAEGGPPGSAERPEEGGSVDPA